MAAYLILNKFLFVTTYITNKKLNPTLQSNNQNKFVILYFCQEKYVGVLRGWYGVEVKSGFCNIIWLVGQLLTFLNLCVGFRLLCIRGPRL